MLDVKAFGASEHALNGDASSLIFSRICEEHLH